MHFHACKFYWCQLYRYTVPSRVARLCTPYKKASCCLIYVAIKRMTVFAIQQPKKDANILEISGLFL